MSLDVYLTQKIKTQVFSSNVTHNMSRMADACGVYDACWQPEIVHKKPKARHIIKILQNGIDELERAPSYYKQCNPENEWGSYTIFLQWLKDYLQACKDNPNARISVWR